MLYTWRKKLAAQAPLAADDLSGTGFAEAIVVADSDAPRPGSGPALVVELGRGRRMTIFPDAPAGLVTAALKALR